jgi:hypothetical protein
MTKPMAPRHVSRGARRGEQTAAVFKKRDYVQSYLYCRDIIFSHVLHNSTELRTVYVNLCCIFLKKIQI